MLHLPALSGIGFATALAILVWTSRTMASAARAWIWLFICGLACPPDRRTVTSVIAGKGLSCLHGAWGCWVLATFVAMLAYDAGVGLICAGWADVCPFALAFPFHFLLWRSIRMKPLSARTFQVGG